MAERERKTSGDDPGAEVVDIFSGKVSVADAIERLRTRLLDLSARNSLLNYRHPKGRSVQLVDEPDVDLIFQRLFLEGKAVPFKYVPEPSPDSYEGRRPDARLTASKIGISQSVEARQAVPSTRRQRLDGVQTLFYPAELERQLRKIASEAKTAIEETGTNMLFLLFGFLELFDSDDSERPMLAPLLALPVTLTRGEVDRDSRTYRYSVQHNGEDLAENHTLREKLRRDFTLSLPELSDEEEPESYFSRIERAVATKRRWRVRRQVSLGMLSFGKLAIWADLDTRKNAPLLRHDLVKSVFSGIGSGGTEGKLYAEEYPIDERPEAHQALIYTADTSQHSAIIDVLSGKSIVVNGPPGTGKSQTITNIIAAGLAKGWKVLFVSEKLAALEVVRHRLNGAGLGHFCLELHSHKTQKKKFLEDIQARIEAHFRAPAHAEPKLAILARQKAELARYAALMGSRVGNALGLTINEVFWAAERRRQELADRVAAVTAIGFPTASKWTHDDLESRRAKLVTVAELHDLVGGFGSNHPWWGFRPQAIAPSDDETVSRALQVALEHALSADSAAEAAVSYFGFKDQPDAAAASEVLAVLMELPLLPQRADPSLFPRMFEPDTDPKGVRSSRLLVDIKAGVSAARRLLHSAAGRLAEGVRLRADDAETVRRRIVECRLTTVFLSTEIGDSLGKVSELGRAAEQLAICASEARAPYGSIGKAQLNEFLAGVRERLFAELHASPVFTLADGAARVLEVVRTLDQSLAILKRIAERGGIPFDASADAVAMFADANGIRGLSSGVVVDEPVISEAFRLAAHPLANRSVAELERIANDVSHQASECGRALARCTAAAQRIGLDRSATSVAEIAAVASIARSAPRELLEFRRHGYGHARIGVLIARVRSAIAEDKADGDALQALFHLDALPNAKAVKAAVSALRRDGGLFSFLDHERRAANRLYASICRQKRKSTRIQRAEELAKLATWMERRSAFEASQEFKDAFGGLFRGFNTIADDIACLDQWYRASRDALLGHPGLVDRFNLTMIAEERLAELAVKADSVQSDVVMLCGLDSRVHAMLGTGVSDLEGHSLDDLETTLANLLKTASEISEIAAFFKARADASLRPTDIARLLQVRAELTTASSDVTLLMRGRDALMAAGGDVLGPLTRPRFRDWTEALGEISANAAAVARMASQALAFCDGSASLGRAIAFAEAKRELDELWEHISSVPARNKFETWTELADGAIETASAARSALESVVPYCRVGVSVADFLIALEEESEAAATLRRLSESEHVRRMLGDKFDGANTDLQSLFETHAWGASVSAARLPAAVRRRLLASDASLALDESRRLYGNVHRGCQLARESVEMLGQFGSFSWVQWQQQARTIADRDRPSEIRARLEAVTRSPISVLEWAKYLSSRQLAEEEGLSAFVVALESGAVPSVMLASAFEFATYQSIGRAIHQSFPELSRFNGLAHEKTRNDFRALDAEIIAITGKSFASQIAKRAKVPEGHRGATVGEYTDMALLHREINKQRRHIPIRQLVKRAGRALQELKPCFMMGPLSVAQYLEMGALEFDLVVMDEASQLRPEEAVGAIARGKQLVVVGDPKQLPPTSFFDRMLDSGDEEDEDEAPAAITGMESILDICQQLFTPVRSLRWHYRSHHESLIAFSNHHFYKNLIVFPSPYAKHSRLGVKYRYVRDGVYKDRQNVPEAQRVVDSIVEHMLKRQDESLGVVTLNQTQRELIEELLEKKLRTFKECAEFIELWESEGWPFFIKNLENVQGDERDVIFISTTFGKAEGTASVRQNFGPISRPDGWRRLNVLFTRSKRRVELFTSMVPEDIVIDEKSPLGTKALRDYLDFARRGVLGSADYSGPRDPDSDFEISVATVVASMGYEVKPQLGVAGFFIDMAVRNPDRPGEFLAGIECDGATYHSKSSVRDRDRIRQEIIESLGWKGRIYRIWSTDWFYNPRAEIERLRSFLDERRRLSSEAPQEDDWKEVPDQSGPEAVHGADEAEEIADNLSGLSGDAEDLFVEVGDLVTYCLMDDPSERRNVHIVDSESNAKMGIVNERTPLAQALLGLSQGELATLEMPGQPSKQLRILRIQRQSTMLL
ncbi:DUF4011 domain-containing protein [Tahibacter amnicola]|uniref:DUF4011 domain-containing protein n=1 Tax=Tahibacter amnicola TaxID=2976241 RepID=A0ABY6B7U0_9GAMM|nr:DUF4011 domain-containing protein [Tahibacter amnicola]UXI66156.1 DUF4011 domain-containing protein [Tahibacter amnicola]